MLVRNSSFSASLFASNGILRLTAGIEFLSQIEEEALLRDISVKPICKQLRFYRANNHQESSWCWPLEIWGPPFIKCLSGAAWIRNKWISMMRCVDVLWRESACLSDSSFPQSLQLIGSKALKARKLLQSATRGWTFLTHPFRQAVLHTDIRMSSASSLCFKTLFSWCLYHWILAQHTVYFVLYDLWCLLDLMLSLGGHPAESFSSLLHRLSRTTFHSAPRFRPFSHTVDPRIFHSRSFSFEVPVEVLVSRSEQITMKSLGRLISDRLGHSQAGRSGVLAL